MTSYELSRSIFDFSFENPEKIKPVHISIFFFAIEHCNRLGWKEKFGLPTSMAMEAIGVKSYNTYIGALRELVDWRFINMIEVSRNQYSSNIIALSNFNKAHNKALDKALTKHSTKQSESTVQSTVQSIDSITKQYNKEQYNNITNITRGEETPLLETELLIPVKAEKKEKEKSSGQKERNLEILDQSCIHPEDPLYEITWLQLCDMPKWKSKPRQSLEATIKKLKSFDEQFAIELMNNAIAGNYQGVTFSDTQEKYLKYLDLKINGKSSNKQKPDLSRLAGLADSILTNYQANGGFASSKE